MVDTKEIKINCCALILAIFSGCTLETAFEKIESSDPDKVKPQLSAADIQDMRKFREEGLTYPTIAGYYGATKDLIYGRLNPRVYSKKGSVEEQLL